MRIIFIRQQDYWIFPISVFGVLFAVLFLYTGVAWMRLISGLLGFSILFFIYKIVEKNYSRKLAVRYLAISLSSVALTAAVVYLLTK